MDALNFCMITTFYPPYAFGGDAVYLYRLSNALARLGHSVDVIHCIDSYRMLTNRPPAPGYPHEPGVTVHGLESGLGRLSPMLTHQTGSPLLKRKKIQEILASKRFDVTHFHNISLIGGPGILQYGQGLKLYTTHEHWMVCPTHVLFKFKQEPCEKPSCLRCSLIYHRPPQLWRYTGMLQKAARHVDMFISPSEFTIERHQRGGLDLPFVHIPLFVTEAAPASESTPEQEEIPLPARPFFLFVGRLEKLKGLHTVIPAFHKYPDADLVIAGSGDYEAELKSLAAGCERIHFLGRLAPSQLRAVYARALALLVPSITYETFGQVSIEAFAARTPVIARDLGPFPEIVRQSGGGLLFHDEASLIEAMTRLQMEPGLRDRMAEAGYCAYCANWTEEAHMERYLNLIADLRQRKLSS